MSHKETQSLYLLKYSDVLQLCPEIRRLYDEYVNQKCIAEEHYSFEDFLLTIKHQEVVESWWNKLGKKDKAEMLSDFYEALGKDVSKIQKRQNAILELLMKWRSA